MSESRDDVPDVAHEVHQPASRRRTPRASGGKKDAVQSVSKATATDGAALAGENEFSLLRKEIDLLTTIVEKREPKLLLMSSLAFVLSLGTALVSAYTAHQKDIHDEQQELAVTLQQLQDMPIKTQDMITKFKSTPMEFFVTGALSNQTTTLLYHARDLALDLGSAAPASSLLAVGEALASQPDYVGATKVLELAIANARNFIDETSALRELGFIEVFTGDTPMIKNEGNALFEKAMGVATKYPDVLKQPPFLAYTYGWTESSWAAAWAPSDCDKAKAHLDEASKWAEKSGQGPVTDQLLRKIAGIQGALPQACGNRHQP
jgi:hypothetical protein